MQDNDGKDFRENRVATEAQNRRLMTEYKRILKNPVENILAHPLE